MRFIPLFLALSAGTGFGQHAYSPADIDAGGTLYRSNCMKCHGPEGTMIAGVDLGHGTFRRASTDDDLARIIINGIPSTAMPPSGFSELQVKTIVAYLRSRANAGTAVSSEAARGKAIFEGKGGCHHCHRIYGDGPLTGPDLSQIGVLRGPLTIRQSIVDPDTTVPPENRYVRAVTRDGATFTGRVLSDDTFGLQILDSHEKLVSLAKANLREYAFLPNPMPSFRGKLSDQEISDLVSYLETLKGVAP